MKTLIFSLTALLLCFLVFGVTEAQESDELLFVLLLHRHGDRAPITQLPVISNTIFRQQWPLGLGELTGLGMTMLHDLGERLRAEYVGPSAQNANFLSEHYDASQIYCRSSDVHRTLQSATSLEYALFPLGEGPNNTVAHASALPASFQPIPISTVPTAQDNLLVGVDWANANCPNVQAALQRIITSPAWEEKAAANRDLFAALTNITGLPVSMLTATMVLDVFVCYQAHQYDNFAAVTPAMWQQLQDLVKWIYARSMTDYGVLRTQISTLMTAIRGYLDAAASGTSPLRFVHLSGHDTTVMPTLAALQIWDGELIPYAANIVFELRRPTDGLPYVTISYQGQPMQLPFCNNQTQCPLSVLDRYLRNYDAVNLAAWCGAPLPADTALVATLQRVVIALGVSVGVLLVALVAVIARCVRRGDRQHEFKSMDLD